MKIEERMEKYITEQSGERKWKVTRIWYVEAKKAVDAVQKTKNWNHDEVKTELVKK